MLTFTGKRVGVVFTEEGEINHEKHCGKRNQAVLLPDGRAAVNPDGSPQVSQVSFVLMYLKVGDLAPFAIEVTPEQADSITYGTDVILTIEPAPKAV